MTSKPCLQRAAGADPSARWCMADCDHGSWGWWIGKLLVVWLAFLLVFWSAHPEGLIVTNVGEPLANVSSKGVPATKAPGAVKGLHGGASLEANVSAGLSGKDALEANPSNATTPNLLGTGPRAEGLHGAIEASVPSTGLSAGDGLQANVSAVLSRNGALEANVPSTTTPNVPGTGLSLEGPEGVPIVNVPSTGLSGVGTPEESGQNAGPFAVHPSAVEAPNVSAILNSRILAKIFRRFFTIEGFTVYAKETIGPGGVRIRSENQPGNAGPSFRRNSGPLVGYLPEYYLGFPRSGSTSAHAFMNKALPCMVKGLPKEPHFWTRRLVLGCNLDHGGVIITRSCNVQRIANQLARYLSHSGAGYARARQSGACSAPILVDGSASTLWERVTAQNITLDMPELIRQLSPKAKFIALIRDVRDHLRSEHFYFTTHHFRFQSDHEQSPTYEKALIVFHKSLGVVRSCSDLCSLAPGLTHLYPRLSMFAESCHLRRWRADFGGQSVFVTNITLMTTCSDGFLSWMKEPLRPCPTEELHRNAQPDMTVSPAARMLEGSIIEMLSAVGCPLLLR